MSKRQAIAEGLAAGLGQGVATLTIWALALWLYYLATGDNLLRLACLFLERCFRP